MRTLLLAILFSASIAGSALAAEAPPPAPNVPDKSTELTYAEIAAAYQGLTALDGYQKIVEEGGKSRAVLQAYEFSEATREAIADDQIALKEIVDREQAAGRVFVKSLGEAPKDGAPGTAKWNREIEDYNIDVSQKKFKVVLILLNRDELKLGVNAIPPSVLAAINPATKRGR